MENLSKRVEKIVELLSSTIKVDEKNKPTIIKLVNKYDAHSNTDEDIILLVIDTLTKQ